MQTLESDLLIHVFDRTARGEMYQEKSRQFMMLAFHTVAPGEGSHERKVKLPLMMVTVREGDALGAV